MKCSVCGARWLEDQDYCLHCGSKVPTRLFPRRYEVAQALSTLYAASAGEGISRRLSERICNAIDGLRDDLLHVDDIEPILDEPQVIRETENASCEPVAPQKTPDSVISA